MPESSAPASAAKPLSPMQKALRKLGRVGPMDFALHVPLRYEDNPESGKSRGKRQQYRCLYKLKRRIILIKIALV